jgi:hypothetical protein
MNLWQSWIGIDNLDCVILVVKKWLNDIHLKWTRAKEKTLEHLKTLIKEHKKLIEEQGLFEEDLDFDWKNM